MNDEVNDSCNMSQYVAICRSLSQYVELKYEVENNVEICRITSKYVVVIIE